MKSTFDLISPERFDRLCEEQGWVLGPEEGISFGEKDSELHQQTEMFWYLQLQFLSIDKTSEAAYNTLTGIYFSPMYTYNKFTRKIRQILFESHWRGWTDEEFACLCTHFALQLAGIEE